MSWRPRRTASTRSSTKLLAFALGATTAGLAGVFNASKLTIVSPDQFYFTVSFTVLAMVILGGMGNIWGVAAGAFIVYMIQAVFLKQLNSVKEMLEHPADRHRPDPLRRSRRSTSSTTSSCCTASPSC